MKMHVFASRFAAAVALGVLAGFQVMAGATLDVDLTVSHGVYTSGELATSRSVVSECLVN